MAHHRHLNSIQPRALACGIGLALLAACNRSEPPPRDAAAPPAAAPPAPAPPVAFRVTRIDLGTAVGPDQQVTAPAVAFTSADPIYASVVTEGTAANVAITARWTFEDGQLVNETTQTISPTGPAATAFHIAKPDGWPAGMYKVEIAANGQPAGSKQFTVTPPG